MFGLFNLFLSKGLFKIFEFLGPDILVQSMINKTMGYLS